MPGDAIIRVVLGRAGVEVVRVDATSYIAGVADQQALGYWLVVVRVRDAMSPLIVDAPVATRV